MIRTICALFVLALPTGAYASAPQGIPRQLARERAARVSNARYRISFELTPRAPTTNGREELRFTLHGTGPLLLDFRDGKLLNITLNGHDLPATLDNGHIDLPASDLHEGENVVDTEFVSNVAPSGKPLISFDDRDDSSEYIYTLFVPMDASMAFPCFDQPDIKGRFQLTIGAPKDWTVISNTPVERSQDASGSQRQTVFAQTRPISTYLFAFAAGPFRKVHDTLGLPGLYVRKSQFSRAQSEAPDVQEIAAEGIKYLSAYFAQPFPFPKYDMVLIPGFAYGGMEHAGATFLREESVLFRTAPTQIDRLGRDILVLHELTHQWFGDLVTMRWFDDLWLKEGFAQYMAYQALASLKPNEQIWKRFYESIKPGAYEIDSTQGTTPIYQDIPNLDDAKSAYGAIVYSKAPGVLKQLNFYLGAENFRNGLRMYLKDHAYSNATWSDLVHALEQSSGKPLGPWADMWIRHRGMPQVDVSWSCTANRLTHLSLSQHDVLGTDAVWPIATQVLLSDPNGNASRIRVELRARTAEVPVNSGATCPAFVFANDQDNAYGRFLLDARSERYVLAHLGGVQDVFTRALLWGSLWDSVREAQLAPREYLDLSLKLLPQETDLSLLQTILGSSTTALRSYVSDKTRMQFVPQFEALAAGRMIGAVAPSAGDTAMPPAANRVAVRSPDEVTLPARDNNNDHDLRILWFRGFRSIAETPAGLAKLKALLNGRLSIPGVQLRPLDRWTMVTTLIALNDPEAQSIFAAERKRDPSGDGQKYAYVAEAATPTAEVKAKYFNEFLHDPARPEDWIELSLRPFNYWNQSALTRPYLKPALEALPQIKTERKIFFLVDWLDAFVDGQQSACGAGVPHAALQWGCRVADSEVHQYLRTPSIEPDLRLKILQAVDELDRTVRIRQKFPD
ncbi:MAG TPA: M1 family aminopeptidase [Candidatus Acidoferrum sp.]|nr:M1 family aminopeptidase [Candidatus Acidoferrum sp.]